MANPITYTNHKSKEFLSGASRYLRSRVVYYGNPTKLTFTTYKKRTSEVHEQDNYAVIPGGAEYRPDKVSQEVYGIPDLWWKILEANGMKDIFEFKAGRTIRLPYSVYD